MKSMICTNPITRLPILGSRRDSLVSPVIPDVFDSEPAFEGRQGRTVGHAGEPVTCGGRSAISGRCVLKPRLESASQLVRRQLWTAPSPLGNEGGEQLRPMQDLRRIVVVLVPGDGLCSLDHRHVVIYPFPNRRRRLVHAARAMHLGRQEIPYTYENANLVVVPAVARGRDLRTFHDAPPLSAPRQTPPAAGLANPV